MKFGSNHSGTQKLRRARMLLLTTFCFLSTAYCLLPTAYSQYGRPPESTLPQGRQPEILKSVTIEQKLNEQLPLDTAFRDEAGREVRLGEYFKAGRPVIVALVYYECPMMCNQILNSMTGALMGLKFTPGKEFEVVTISFDAREGPELAASKKNSYMRRYARAGAESGWHFLTGSQDSIDRLTKAVGFNYAWDDDSKQFAHGAAIMVATPDGQLSHYFYGVDYEPKNIRLALVEASKGEIGSPVDQFLLYCYHYDPTTGKYGPAILNIVRVAGVATIIGMVTLVFVLQRRRRRGAGERWEEKIDAGGAA